MPARDLILSHLEALLPSGQINDYGPNGLQVEGAAEVRRVVTGVTACLELIQAAAGRGAQMLVVHHGIIWDHERGVLKGHFKKRVQALLEADMTLLAYHLPLDRHLELGNNAPALRALGAGDLEPFAEHRGVKIGWKGCFEEPLQKDEFLARVEAFYGQKPRAFLHGPELVASVGCVSGAAQGDLATAVEEGLDAFITGEVSEYNPHVAREEGIHHLSVGHHASERVGPRLLARYLADTFDLEVDFVDIPNPV